MASSSDNNGSGEVDTTKFPILDRWESLPQEVRAKAVAGLASDMSKFHSSAAELKRQVLDWGSSYAGGKHVMTVQRMGGRYERVIRDRMGQRTVVTADKDISSGRIVNIRMFGVPVDKVDPEIVANAWGIKFNSVFQNVVPDGDSGINKATREAWEKKRKGELDEKSRQEKILRARNDHEISIFDDYTRLNWTKKEWDRYKNLDPNGRKRVFENILRKNNK